MKKVRMKGVARCRVAFGLAVLACQGALADGIQPGLWRVINKPEINGSVGPTTQNMRCLTAADVADLDKTFSPVSRTVNSTCERVEHGFTPQRLKWRLQCTGLVAARSSMAGRLMQAVRTQIERQSTGECR